ncbi:MAG: Tm-1-like ATP-binding domain-containing protein [Dehalococcoidales bacterium]|nr:MAG: Tm-1-like ATP-binding domain-containing protein [Dehalococcoidales bacterium]
MAKQKKTIVLFGRLDSKGKEYGYVKNRIIVGGCEVITVDTGTRGSPELQPDISREEVARAAGKEIKEVVDHSDESKEIEVMMEGASVVARQLYDKGKLDGVMCLGGSRGTAIGTAVMRALPFGIPKFMVSTIASGDMRPYVGTSDITVLHSVTDIVGLNRMTRKLLSYAAGSVVGAVNIESELEVKNKPVIAMSAMGGINRAAFKAQEILEDKGFEVVTFHAVGTGGRAMEETIGQGLIDGVLDLVTHELIDHLYNGYYDAGPDRLEMAGKKGIPQVVVPGCLDFIAFSPPSNIPEEIKKREIFWHTPEVAIVRANKTEMEFTAKVLAEKLNRAVGPVAIVIPVRGFSPGNRESRSLYDPEADTAFIDTLKKSLNPVIRLVEVDAHINDEIFAGQAVSLLCEMITERKQS